VTPSRENYLKRRLGTDDLLIKIACFVTELSNILNLKISYFKPGSAMRLTVLNLPPSLRDPGPLQTNFFNN
jgi:hypothetical protein